MVVEIALGIVLGVILLALLPLAIGASVIVFGIGVLLAVVGAALFFGWSALSFIFTSPQEALEIGLGLLMIAGGLALIGLIGAPFGYLAHRKGLLRRDALKPYPQEGAVIEKLRWVAGLMLSGFLVIMFWFYSGLLVGVLVATITEKFWVIVLSGVAVGPGIFVIAYYQGDRLRALFQRRRSAPENTAVTASKESAADF